MVAEKDTYSKHISHKFNEELSELKNHLMVMGGMVEKQVEDAIEALMEGDTEKAMEVRRQDKEVDKLELVIDDEAVHVIAMRQPAASDLRLVMSVVKMVADLERIGDEAKKIAKLTVEMGSDSRSNRRSFVEVRNISVHVRTMIRDALDAFSRFDTDQALAVMREDDAVDDEYKSATRALVTHMMEDARSITSCLNQMWVLRALERVGDHAENLAEHVVFMVEGTDVRHTPAEDIEKVVRGKK
ncbi:MAG: phosphate transport system regulatory protein PhoU [Halomonadaceae bacterium]|nr:MAG: phosphate transport system regulatory protein PhoU [Halomonadaceae bacterium]